MTGGLREQQPRARCQHDDGEYASDPPVAARDRDVGSQVSANRGPDHEDNSKVVADHSACREEGQRRQSENRERKDLGRSDVGNCDAEA